MTIHLQSIVKSVDNHYVILATPTITEFVSHVQKMIMKMIMTINYPSVNFKSFLNQTQTFNNVGYLIGEYLSVGWTNSLYQSISIFNQYGYKVVPVSFLAWDDAVQFAELLDQHYKDYFILWNDNQQANVPQLTRYTIPDGERLHDVIKHFSGKNISYKEFMDEYTRFIA